jgi:hypothetical protein
LKAGKVAGGGTGVTVAGTVVAGETLEGVVAALVGATAGAVVGGDVEGAVTGGCVDGGAVAGEVWVGEVVTLGRVVASGWATTASGWADSTPVARQITRAAAPTQRAVPRRTLLEIACTATVWSLGRVIKRHVPTGGPKGGSCNTSPGKSRSGSEGTGRWGRLSAISSTQ